MFPRSLTKTCHGCKVDDTPEEYYMHFRWKHLQRQFSETNAAREIRINSCEEACLMFSQTQSVMGCAVVFLSRRLSRDVAVSDVTCRGGMEYANSLI